MLVGIAGGIKDVTIGDVVAVNQVYSYDFNTVNNQSSGKNILCDYGLVQRAKAEARKTDWLQRLPESSDQTPHVFVAPIASVDKVIRSSQSEEFRLLRANNRDAILVEMEGFGFLSAASAYSDVKALIIRGISDLIDYKSDYDFVTESRRQEKAAHHASAFAFEVLAKTKIDTSPTISIQSPKIFPNIKTNIKILLLAANSKSTNRLMLDEKAREIHKNFRLSGNRDRLVLHEKWAVRTRDIRRAILETSPQIIHFLGSDIENEGLVLENEMGEVNTLSEKNLIDIFKLFVGQITCVVLDGCSSEVQAETIVQYVDYVISISTRVNLRAVTAFLTSFYNALITVQSVETAYSLGCNAIDLEGITEGLRPVLKRRPYLELRQYEQQLQQYEESFLESIRKEFPIANETRNQLRSIPLSFGIELDDIIASETRIEDMEVIRKYTANKIIKHHQRLAEAIIRCIRATDFQLIDIPELVRGSIWEISLPETVFRLRTKKAIFCLEIGEGKAFYNRLTTIANERDAIFLIVGNVMSDRQLPTVAPLQTIQLSGEALNEMIEVPEEQLLAWLTRFLLRQININVLPGILPYQTKGATKLFFGREDELARLVYGSQKGGIILGANRSGKTSLLQYLGTRLEGLGNQVIGPLTILGLPSFFADTWRKLGYKFSPDISLEDWSSTLKSHVSMRGNQNLSFLLDEVDQIFLKNTKQANELGWHMRALQNEGYCKFYLAGHKSLREAVVVEGGPFRNFAEEIILTGLNETDAIGLIQKPMESLGFSISEGQAYRIYLGTDGVAVLIQEFCIKLLGIIRQNSLIQDSDIEKVETLPSFLDIVFEHYKYAQTWESMTITILAAMSGQIDRKQLTHFFSKRGINLEREKLDSTLNFLVQFGVLKEFELGRFKLASSYLTKAINVREPQSLLEAELLKYKPDGVQ